MASSISRSIIVLALLGACCPALSAHVDSSKDSSSYKFEPVASADNKNLVYFDGEMEFFNGTAGSVFFNLTRGQSVQVKGCGSIVLTTAVAEVSWAPQPRQSQPDFMLLDIIKVKLHEPINGMKTFDFLPAHYYVKPKHYACLKEQKLQGLHHGDVVASLNLDGLEYQVDGDSEMIARRVFSDDRDVCTKFH